MLTIMLLIALAPIKPAPVFADYVLNVPVRVENMRNVTSAYVTCTILHVDASSRVALAVATRTDVPLVDGAYNGTVTVTVPVPDANAIRNPPNTYGCSLVYVWRNPDGTTFNTSLLAGERATAYTRLTGQEVAESTTEITGPIPPP